MQPHITANKLEQSKQLTYANPPWTAASGRVTERGPPANFPRQRRAPAQTAVTGGPSSGEPHTNLLEPAEPQYLPLALPPAVAN